MRHTPGDTVSSRKRCYEMYPPVECQSLQALGSPVVVRLARGVRISWGRDCA